jgi:hypothetical protein
VRRLQESARSKEIQGVLMAVGNITVSWAGISLILNLFIEAHHNQFGKPIRSDLPRDFTAKLDYIKKVECDPRWDSQRLEDLREIRLELAALNQRRVNLVHGLLVRRGLGWAIHLAKEQGDNLLRKDVPHTGDEIHAFSRELADMGGRLSLFFAPIFKKS